MENTVALIGCRVRPFMENGAVHGYRVTALDGFNDWDAVRFGRLLPPEKANNGPCSGYERFEAVENLLFCGPVETSPAVIDTARRKFNVLNPPSGAVAVCRTLSFLKKVAGNGMDFPDTDYDGHGNWVIKSLNSSGGTGIRAYDGRPNEGEYSQRLIDGQAIGACFAGSSGGETRLIGISRHITGDPLFRQPPFQYGGLIYPADVGRDAEEILGKFGKKVAESSGISGFWGADFILSNEKLWLLEINPRFTATLELIALEHGLDLVAEQGGMLNGAGPPALTAPARVRGTAVCYADGNMVFGKPADWFAKGARDIPHGGEMFKKGEPVISIYANGDSAEQIISRLKKTAADFYAESHGNRQAG